jgi:hypothetical protein
MNPRTLLGLSLLLILLGCTKLTMENYDKIAVGMTYDQVVKLIGQPDKCDDVMGMRTCTWGDKKRSVHVSFAGDQVLLYSSNNLK